MHIPSVRVSRSGGVISIGVSAVAWNVERCAMWNEAARAVGWNVERCVMWNEVEYGLWDGMWNEAVCAVAWNVERCVMWNEVDGVGCGMECGTLRDVERGKV